jgi:Zn-finger nucleic acid-binding protein
MEKEKCPNCDIELDSASLSDIDAGDVLISVTVEYCPDCLYVSYSQASLSK